MTSTSALLGNLEHALTGGRPLLLGQRPTVAIPEDVALVVGTSGSTGTSRPVGLTTAALRASADGTAQFLHGPGQWLLTLPATHIAGVQVLCRSILAGITPVVRADEPLAAAIASMREDVPRYTSLVPTQLMRILTDPDAHADLRALTELDAVLVGGSAIEPETLRSARRAGVRVVTTYGMTETSGGCVYDGHPLAGVQAQVSDERVWLSGPMLASGYLDDGPQPFETHAGRRWFRTSDLGRWDGDGTLTILGRADDVLITGGMNVNPLAVEQALIGEPGFEQLAIVGLPSAEWGTEVAAVVTGMSSNDPQHLLRALRARVTASLGSHAAPRTLFDQAALPVRGPGKVDRRNLAAWIRHRTPLARY